jgi:hypothetical protein
MDAIACSHGDATELAQLLTFIAEWLSGTQKPTLTASLASFVGHNAYNTDELRRPAPVRVPPRRQRRRRTLRRPHIMINNLGPPAPRLERITHITTALMTHERCPRRWGRCLIGK